MRSFLVKLALKRQKGFFEKLEEFEKSQYWSKAEIQAYQEEKLQKLIKHAYETVPFYRGLFNRKKLKPNDIKKISDLEKMPILGKETFRNNCKKIRSTGINERCYFRRTGGSTGVPLSIANNVSSIIIEHALYYRYLRWIGYQWGGSILKIWGEPVVESNLSKLRGRISRFVHNYTFVSTFNVNEKNLLNLVMRIKNKPPLVMRGYTSSIYLLALNFLDLKMKIKLNAVSPTAEKLFKFQRKKMIEAFGENIYDQYGCGETNSIAFECEKHEGLHVASEHTILEIVDKKNQVSNKGKVIITNLDNYAMPIIRYENGDMASWADRKCSCGRNLPLLKEIDGRVCEFIEGTNKNKVHGEFFTHIFDGLRLSEKYRIKEFRVVQKQIDKIIIEFVTEDNLDKKDVKIIKNKVNKYLGETEIEIKKVKFIPMTKRGKKMFIISMLNKNEY